MAYSIIGYQNNYTRIHDLDLGISMLLILANHDLIEEFAFKDMEISWLNNLKYAMGNGCIDLYLDDYLNSKKQIECFIILIDSALSLINDFQTDIPMTFLQFYLNKIDYVLSDNFPKILIYNSLIKLQKIILGDKSKLLTMS